MSNPFEVSEFLINSVNEEVDDIFDNLVKKHKDAPIAAAELKKAIEEEKANNTHPQSWEQVNKISMEDLQKLFTNSQGEVKTYDICYAGYKDWEIDADEIEYKEHVVILKLKGKVQFITGTSHLLYINPQEN